MWIENFGTIALPIAAIILGLCALGALAFGVIGMLRDVKKALPSLIFLAILVVIFFITRNFVDPTLYDQNYDHSYIMSVGGGLTTFWVLLGITVVALIAGEIWNLIK